MIRKITFRAVHGWVLLMCLAALLVVVPVGSASGQVAGGRRVYNEQLRVRLDRQVPQAREISFDAGGWLDIALFNFDDAVGQKHTLRQFQVRGWATLNVKNVHKFYVRGLAGWDDWNAGDNPKGYVGDEDTDPIVERAWYEFN
ncbi:MAG: hypothetical protein ACYSTL_01945, partial [Planctomycetota bacterium]